MEEISVNDLSAMCRLCLSRGATEIDIFCFSHKMESRVVEVIMMCAPVQITKSDGMPNFICRLCYTQLENIHQFQTQVVQSDKTLRCFLQQLRTSDKQIKTECSTSLQEPSEDPLIYNSNPDITVKCESLELHNVIDIGEPTNDNSLFSTERADDTSDESSQISYEDRKPDISDIKLEEGANVHCEEKETGQLHSTDKINGEMCLKFEPQADDVFRPGYSDGTASVSSNCDGNEISCENIKPDIEHTSGNSANLRSADMREKREEKNTSINRIKSKFYPRNVCNKRFTTSGNLNIHKRMHTGEKPYQCDVCNKCFSYLSSFSAHKRIHTGDKPYKCDVCNKCFTESCTLNTHKRTHADVKQYQCDICNKRFIRLDHMKSHKRVHTNEKPYWCDVCNQSFTQSCNLNIHKRTHTGVKSNKCDVCNKCFTTSGYLNIHKRTHTGEKPYQCDVCSKGFTMSSQLNVHKRTHTDVKPYQCNVCNKQFSVASRLTTHKIIHTGEKPYQCDVCKKSFNSLGYLNVHKGIHTNVKYQCDVCNKCFAQSTNLNRHKRIHTGKKPYNCDVCNKCFSQSSHLQRHKRVHADVKPYQ